MSSFGWGLLGICALACISLCFLVWIKSRKERERRPKNNVKQIIGRTQRQGQALQENEQPDSVPRPRPIAISSQFPADPCPRRWGASYIKTPAQQELEQRLAMTSNKNRPETKIPIKGPQGPRPRGQLRLVQDRGTYPIPGISPPPDPDDLAIWETHRRRLEAQADAARQHLEDLVQADRRRQEEDQQRQSDFETFNALAVQTAVTLYESNHPSAPDPTPDPPDFNGGGGGGFGGGGSTEGW